MKYYILYWIIRFNVGLRKAGWIDGIFVRAPPVLVDSFSCTQLNSTLLIVEVDAILFITILLL
jgi:hypothetical protein